MTKKSLVLFAVLAVALSTIVLAQVFDSESAARLYRDSFSDSIVLTGDPLITDIYTNLDVNTVTVAWSMQVYNGITDTTVNIAERFSIPKAQLNNDALIKATLKARATKEFQSYNVSNIPNPKIRFASHSLYNKTVNVGLPKARPALLDRIRG